MSYQKWLPLYIRMDPSLTNILEQDTLKWIFVGGKGGVGKTTTSCSLAIQLAKVRPSVLLISTDPAHNLSDAFCQKFSKDPTLVSGFSNLYAMEIDPNAKMQELVEQGGSSSGLMSELSMAIPGVDEAMGFAEVMKLVQSMDYSVIVFDTAPTGHTLRFLSFPSILQKGLEKLSSLSTSFGPMFNQISAMMGVNANQQDIFGKMNELRAVVEEVNRQFQNPDKTTFICVCIAEFLSLYETERLVQELVSYNIDTHNVVVNQLLSLPVHQDCSNCVARSKIQQKYLSQIHELYEDFHVVELPLLGKEVRGVDELSLFSEKLVGKK